MMAAPPPLVALEAPAGPNYTAAPPTTELDMDDHQAPSPISEVTGPMLSGTPVPERPPGPLSFQAGAWKYVPIGLLSILLFFIPIFGWALQWQISNRFVVQHLSIEGRRLKFTMTYGYALKLILRHLLLLICTLGLGLFWLYVKETQAIYAHVEYADEVPS